MSKTPLSLRDMFPHTPYSFSTPCAPNPEFCHPEIDGIHHPLCNGETVYASSWARNSQKYRDKMMKIPDRCFNFPQQDHSSHSYASPAVAGNQSRKSRSQSLRHRTSYGTGRISHSQELYSHSAVAQHEIPGSSSAEFDKLPVSKALVSSSKSSGKIASSSTKVLNGSSASPVAPVNMPSRYSESTACVDDSVYQPHMTLSLRSRK
jgi:hypothetical protein